MNERELIDRILGPIKSENVLVGDDCAVIKIGGKNLLLTTDSLFEDTDFPHGIKPWQMGWCCAAQCLSDVAAMGGKPRYMMVAVSAPEPEMVVEIVKGARRCAALHGVKIVGGDVGRSPKVWTCGTAVGECPNPVMRSGAKVGDLVCVTGTLGRAQAALELMRKGIPVPPSLRRALFTPTPRVKEGISLARNATSMIDISDGLLLSLYDISRSSAVGFSISSDKIPIDPIARRVAEKLGKDPLELANQGWDFELLFTSRRRIKRVCGVDVSVIGEVIEGRSILIDGKVAKVAGYQHF